MTKLYPLDPHMVIFLHWKVHDIIITKAPLYTYLTDASLLSLLANCVFFGLITTKYTTVDESAKTKSTTVTVNRATNEGFFFSSFSDWPDEGALPEKNHPYTIRIRHAIQCNTVLMIYCLY